MTVGQRSWRAPRDEMDDELILLNDTERFLGREQLDAEVVVEHLGLRLVDDLARLVAHVASVVAQAGRLDLRGHNLPERLRWPTNGRIHEGSDSGSRRGIPHLLTEII